MAAIFFRGDELMWKAFVVLRYILFSSGPSVWGSTQEENSMWKSGLINKNFQTWLVIGAVVLRANQKPDLNVYQHKHLSTVII